MALKPVTIKDIAKKLKLHHSTVSRALRNDPRVNAGTREKVVALAEKMQYYPNTVALNLRDRKSKTIGLIVPSIHHHFFSHIISTITNLAYAEGYTVMICQTNEDPEQENLVIQALVQNRVAGVIASVSKETTDPSGFRKFKQNDIPLVFFDRVLENMDATKVVVHNYRGVYEALKLMIQSGYSRIAHITGGLDINVFRDRFKAYKDALHDHGLTFNQDYVVDIGLTKECGIQATERLLNLKNPPDLVFTVAFALASGVILQARRMNVDIPEKLGLLGMGEDPLSTVLCPSVTTIEQPRAILAQRAFCLLFERMQGKLTEPVTEWLDTVLHLRESTKRINQGAGY